MRKPRDLNPLLTFARKATSAWDQVHRAEEALLAAAQGAQKGRHARVLRHLGRAKVELRRAYSAMAPTRSRGRPKALSFRGVTRTPRSEPLWRCRYCSALFWESARRGHLELLERVPSAHWTDDELSAHFTPADRDGLTDDDGEVDDDDLA